MKKSKIVFAGIVAAVIVAAVLIMLSRPGELVVVFPEMSSSQKGFIDPLVTLYEIETGTEVDYLFIKSTEWEKDIKSVNPSGDIYYTVNNYQMQQLEKNGFAAPHRIRGGEGVPDFFFSEPDFLPVSWYPWGVFYNKKIFRELGLGVPESWEDFLAICEAASVNGYPAVALTTKIKWPAALWFDYLDTMLNGRVFHEAVLSGDVAFNDEKVVAVFNELLSLHQNGYIYSDTESFEWQSMIDAVINGKSLMHLSGSFFFEETPEVSKNDLGWFPFPGGDTIVASSSGFFMPENGKNRRQSLKFMRFVLGETAQKVIQDNSMLIAVHSGVSSRLGRTDLEDILPLLSSYSGYIPSFERSTHPSLIIPLKSAVSSLYSISDHSELMALINKLEEYRQSIK